MCEISLEACSEWFSNDAKWETPLFIGKRVYSRHTFLKFCSGNNLIHFILSSYKVLTDCENSEFFKVKYKTKWVMESDNFGLDHWVIREIVGKSVEEVFHVKIAAQVVNS